MPKKNRTKVVNTSNNPHEQYRERLRRSLYPQAAGGTPLSGGDVTNLSDQIDNICDSCLKRDMQIVASSYHCYTCLANLCSICFKPHKAFLENFQVHEVATWDEYIKAGGLLTRHQRETQRKEAQICPIHKRSQQSHGCAICLRLLCPSCPTDNCPQGGVDGCHLRIPLDTALKQKQEIWELVVEEGGSFIQRSSLLQKIDDAIKSKSVSPAAMQEMYTQMEKILNGDEKRKSKVVTETSEPSASQTAACQTMKALEKELRAQSTVDTDEPIKLYEETVLEREISPPKQNGNSKPAKLNTPSKSARSKPFKKSKAIEPIAEAPEPVVCNHECVYGDVPPVLQSSCFTTTQHKLHLLYHANECTSALHLLASDLEGVKQHNSTINPGTGWCAPCLHRYMVEQSETLDITADTKIELHTVLQGNADCWGVQFSDVGHLLCNTCQGFQMWRIRHKKRLRWGWCDEKLRGMDRVGFNLFCVVENRIRITNDAGTDHRDFKVPNAEWLVDVAVNKTMERLAVTDCRAQRVTIHSAGGRLITHFRIMDKHVQSCPMYVSFLRDHMIVVSDVGDIKSVSALDLNGAVLWRYLGSHNSPREPHVLLGTPYGLHTDAKGFTWMCDYDNCQVIVLDNIGQVIKSFKTEGMKEPWLIARHYNGICVYIPRTNELLIYGIGEKTYRPI